MNIYQTKKVAENFYAINEVNSVTLYLLVGQEKAILIDTGYGYGDLLAEIRQITPLPLEVYCTHGHVDHVLGAYLFDKVYLNHNDYPIMKKHVSQEREGNLDYRYQKLPEMRNLVDKKEYLSRSFEHIQLMDLDETSLIRLDDSLLEVMLFPGHSKGSLLFIDACNKRIFTGDSISLHNIWMFQEDSLSMQDYLKSLEKLDAFLKNSGDSSEWTFYPAHEDFPIKYDVLENLIACAKEIVAGQNANDEPFSFFGADGLKHYFKNVSIIYRKDNR